MKTSEELKKMKLDEIISYIKSTGKKVLWTYGLKYRHPNTYLVPINVSEIKKKLDFCAYWDIEEKENYFDLNGYSTNDMW